MNDFVKRARKAAASRHPVRDVVAGCLPDIYAARADGLSWAAIFGQLKRDGKEVGKGPSSLRNAVRGLTAANAPITTPLVGTAGPAAPIAAPPATVPAELGDTRFQRDWS